MAYTVGSGIPLKACIINTDPRKFRFQLKADKDYTIRVDYIANPAAPTSASDTFTIPPEWDEGLYLKFVEKVAMAVGQDLLTELYASRYKKWIGENSLASQSATRKESKLAFSWL